jgi:hypothetical protein
MPRLVNATCPLMPRFANTVCPLPISSVPTTKSYYNQKRYACHPGFHISESTENNKQFLLNQIIWMGVSFGISIAISMLVPFPISLVIIMGVFILLNLYMRNRMMRRMGSGMLFRKSNANPHNHKRHRCTT